MSSFKGDLPAAKHKKKRPQRKDTSGASDADGTLSLIITTWRLTEQPVFQVNTVSCLDQGLEMGEVSSQRESPVGDKLTLEPSTEAPPQRRKKKKKAATIGDNLELYILVQYENEAKSDK